MTPKTKTNLKPQEEVSQKMREKIINIINKNKMVVFDLTYLLGYINMKVILSGGKDYLK